MARLRGPFASRLLGRRGECSIGRASARNGIHAARIERARWKDYMRAYEEAIRATSTEHAPWYVVPADRKWFTRLVVSRIIIDALEGLDLKFPDVDPSQREELAHVRQALLREK